MSTLQRTIDEANELRQAPPGDPSGANLAAARAEAARRASAGDAAIRNALSENPGLFLDATDQEGGE